MIKIVCVGKIKEKYFSMAIEEYAKRISKYTNIEIIELPDEGITDSKVVLKKEKDKIIKYIDGKSYVILLDREGKDFSSVELANKIDSILIHHSNITFIIGGSYGVDDEIKEKADLAITFSKLTFPHQLFRVILLEQIYRSFKILNNESYHK